MSKYHINSRGEPGVCHAQHQCPFGSEDQHFSTQEDARKAYELVMSTGTEWKPQTKKTTSNFSSDVQDLTSTLNNLLRESSVAGVEPSLEWMHSSGITDDDVHIYLDSLTEDQRGDLDRLVSNRDEPNINAKDVAKIVDPNSHQPDMERLRRMANGTDQGVEATKRVLESTDSKSPTSGNGKKPEPKDMTDQELLVELARTSNLPRNHGFPEDELHNSYIDKAEGELRNELQSRLGEQAAFAEISHTVTRQDRAQALDLMIDQLPSQHRKYSWDSVMTEARRSKNNVARYRQALAGVIQNKPEFQEELANRAINIRDQQVYARALEQGATIPEDIYAEFEQVWAGGADDAGSQANLKKNLAQLDKLQSDYEAGNVRPSNIVGKGLRDPRRAVDEYFSHRRDELTRALATRGRSYPVTVANVTYSQKKRA